MAEFYMEFKNPIGRPLKYQPEELAELFADYVQWCKDNPLEEEKTSTMTGGDKGGCVSVIRESHPRYVSVGGFLVFIGANECWWRKLDEGKKGKEFLRVKAGITEYCRNYQIEMASLGYMKQNIISRLLGLTDKKEVATTGEGVTIVVKDRKEKEKLENIGNLGV